MDVDRYPTWLLLAATIAATLAVVVRYRRLDRGATSRATWLKLLIGWLFVIGVAALGLLVSRTGQRITPNEGLLVVGDIMAGLLVISIPISRAARPLTDSELRQIRGPTALWDMLGRNGAIRVIAVACGTIVLLLIGEIALANRLPGPPAVVACQDYSEWITAPANSGMPPLADRGLMNKASDIAPRGPIQDSLAALVADVNAAAFDRGTVRLVDEAHILTDESAVTTACQGVPAVG